ncbi:hypothetical protein [Litorilituus sediminis]|uniref:Uncharacterized protein n=1 Tax=Litorilituus sediminis TaxID=718192 RepID=A0A4V0ZFW0_9GAMM|nr:hypothetical protein [Litorilituus sediminis]QBG35170.1 hypothetical protein EMK97_05285 [Litorilituus sediminis]
MNKTELAPQHSQWLNLHDSIEKYEQWALIIKLTALITCVMTFIFNLAAIFTVVFIALFWLQEAIWKTYQARLIKAITDLESQLNTSNELLISPLYSQWQANRGGTLALIAEYLESSLKPTVMLPYLPLIIISLFA